MNEADSEWGKLAQIMVDGEPLKLGSKIIRLVPQSQWGFFKVALQGGGRVPDELDGFYTSHDEVRTAVVSYVRQKEQAEADKAPAKVQLNGSQKAGSAV